VNGRNRELQRNFRAIRSYGGNLDELSKHRPFTRRVNASRKSDSSAA
jgi:hypothetical protein